MTNDTIKKQSVNVGQPVINRDTGLAQYEGNEEIYKNILENFTKNNQSALTNLKDAIGAGDIKLAHRIAHSLRGAAGTIGASRLANAALDVENTLTPIGGAVSDFSGGETFDEHMMLLEGEFDAVFDELKPLAGETEEYLGQSGVMDREKTIELINKLAPFLETGDTKCLEYMDDIEEVLLSVVEEIMLFITQIESYDFDQAYETIMSIRRFMMP